MFDLEKQIAEWRQEMLVAGIKTPEVLDELENHLREEIERQIKSRLSEPDAFNSAVKKIGQAHLVRNEFKKVKAANEDFDWKWKQISLLITAIILPLWIVGQLFYSKNGFDPEITTEQKISCVAGLITFSLLVWSGQFTCRIFPVIRNKRIRIATIGSCLASLVLWWIVLINFILPHSNFTTGELMVVFTWGFFTPAGIFFALMQGIETAAQKKLSTGVQPAKLPEFRVKNILLTFAGVPNHYVTSAGRTLDQNAPIEPGWMTYIKTTAAIAPVIFLWSLAMAYVVPMVHTVGSQVANTTFPEWLRFNFAVAYLVQDHLILLSAGGMLFLILAEWRIKIWPWYRRSVLGLASFSLNMIFAISLFLFLIATALVVQSAYTHPH